jgi:hypothetical protein
MSVRAGATLFMLERCVKCQVLNRKSGSSAALRSARDGQGPNRCLGHLLLKTWISASCDRRSKGAENRRQRPAVVGSASGRGDGDSSHRERGLDHQQWSVCDDKAIMKAPGATLPRLTSKKKLLKSKAEEHSQAANKRLRDPLPARFWFKIFSKEIYRYSYRL